MRDSNLIQLLKYHEIFRKGVKIKSLHKARKFEGKTFSSFGAITKSKEEKICFPFLSGFEVNLWCYCIS